MILFNTTIRSTVHIPTEIAVQGSDAIWSYAVGWILHHDNIETNTADWVTIKEDYWLNYAIIWFHGFDCPSLYRNDDDTDWEEWDPTHMIPPAEPNPLSAGQAAGIVSTNPVGTITQLSSAIAGTPMEDFFNWETPPSVASQYIDNFLIKKKKDDSMLSKKRAPKKKPLQFESLQAELDFYKKGLDEVEKAFAVQEATLDKMRHDYGVIVNRNRERELELSTLKQQTVDSDKLKNRIKALSKQLGVPLANTKNVNQIMDDFIAQLWCRIKHEQTGPDELAN
jgi:hypothetical protein